MFGTIRLQRIAMWQSSQVQFLHFSVNFIIRICYIIYIVYFTFRKVLVILKLNILVKGDVVGAKIGTPVNYEEIGNTQQTPAQSVPMEVTPSHPAPNRVTPAPSPMRNGK